MNPHRAIDGCPVITSDAATNVDISGTIASRCDRFDDGCRRAWGRSVDRKRPIERAVGVQPDEAADDLTVVRGHGAADIEFPAAGRYGQSSNGRRAPSISRRAKIDDRIRGVGY